MRATIDMNCVIDLELHQGAETHLRELIRLHDRGQITICVPAIQASERLLNGSYAPSFSEFQRRVSRLSSREFKLLRPLGYVGITYVGWCMIAGEESTLLEERIHKVLFPGKESKWQAHAELCGLDPERAPKRQHGEWVKWRNRKSDTLAMWCHIHYQCDCFVTRDRNFHKKTKKPALVGLGARSILSPKDAVRFVLQR